ncbi:MAG: Zn-dependent oxidoreductase, partial [Anaerolineales bacterium]|nr:Zn-dependent oxidoreductase [Anaerolineales bacterium]
MKAIVRHTYGSPAVLQPAEIPTPAPKDDEVLIKIAA